MYNKFCEHEVILNGHFLLTSGKHSDTYISKDKVYCNPILFRDVVDDIINRIRYLKYDVITGPAIAGAVLAAPISVLTGKIFVYPEKIEKELYPGKLETRMEFRRGYNHVIKNKRVLAIEDIITTGGSLTKTVNSIIDCGGNIAGVISLWNRTNFKIPTCTNMTLIDKPVDSWLPDECPLCEDIKRNPLRDPKIFQ